jgi:hypothetical protein
MLPPFLLNGCKDEAAIRTCLEVSKWANMYYKDSDVLLSDSMCLAEKLINDRGDSDRQTVNRCRLRLSSPDWAHIRGKLEGIQETAAASWPRR